MEFSGYRFFKFRRYTFVEHRRESRLKISKNVKLRVVSLMGNPKVSRPLAARVVDVSGSGVRLELPLAVPCGAEVEIEDKNTLVFGQILRCVPKADVYIAAVRVSETTTSATDTRRSMARVPSASRA
jgi:hypothetical protein